MMLIRLLHSDLVERGICVITAMVFYAAAFPKLFDLDGFADTIGAYGILPESLLYGFGLIMVLAEIVGATGLLFRKRWALYLIISLLLVFIAVLSYGVAVGLDIDCGCFGKNDPEYEAFSGLRISLIRDCILLVPLLYICLKPYIIHSHLNRSNNER